MTDMCNILPVVEQLVHALTSHPDKIPIPGTQNLQQTFGLAAKASCLHLIAWSRAVETELCPMPYVV
jgi:hypothetical protein